MKASAVATLACVGVFVIILDTTIVSVALPHIAGDLGFRAGGLAVGGGPCGASAPAGHDHPGSGAGRRARRDTAVPVRVYRPSAADGLPVSTYFHGAGWVTGDLDTHDTVCRDIAAASGAVIVAVDYRRAPELPFPAAPDDCAGVTRRLLAEGAGLGVDSGRVAVTGDSAGGNMAAVLGQELPGLVNQVLVFPVTDAAGIGETTSCQQFGQKHFLTERDLAYFVRSYAGGHATDDMRLSRCGRPI